MADEYGSDFLTIVDEDGKEYELEVLSTLEYNGATYLAVVPAGEEDGEPILLAIEDEEELQTVYRLIMDSLYEEDDSQG